MNSFIIFATVWALVVARPELYKEKEDFQFSRSSSDDGSKSGYYGAQRGNMGGNYERAHNMDSLAQNQMSGLVRQVDGELGDGANTRAGSVYTAANSRGTFGSGNFDLSNLAGRNFQEGTSGDDAHSRSSLSSSSAYNSGGYTNSRSQSLGHSGYQTAGHSGLNLQSDDLQSLDHAQGSGQYGYGRQSSHSAGYQSQSGFQQHNALESRSTNSQSGGYGSNTNTRLISATPVRIIVTPGARVAIPVAAQSYDVTHGSSLVDQNALTSDAETFSNVNQRTVYRPNDAKHYESSYNYRKEWEKHDTIPSTVPLSTPTDNPFPKNSELYEDSQARTTNDHYDARVGSQGAHSRNMYGGYNSNVKSSSAQSRSNYEQEQREALSHSNSNAYTLTGTHNAGSTYQGASSDSSLNGYIQTQSNAGSRYHGAAAAADSNSLTQTGYNAGFNADLSSQVEDLNTKPKSYQSSYSYHKSWEHQGDPYVIKPASSGYNDGQSSQRLTASTYNQGYAASGSHHQHSHQNQADCDEKCHIRIARSYNFDQDIEQQSQQSQKIEELGQQLEDLGQQQTQDNWGQQEAGQQAQNTWDNLEDLTQQSQNKWDRIEDLGQHTQKALDNVEDFGQNSQNNWDQQQEFTQQTQDTNNQLHHVEQQNKNDLEQPIQEIEIKLGNKPQDVGQHTQDKWELSNTGEQVQENYFKQIQDYSQVESNNYNKQENQFNLNKPDISKDSQSSRNENDTIDSHEIIIWHRNDYFHQNKSMHEDSIFNDSRIQNGKVKQQLQKSETQSNLDMMPQSEQHTEENNSSDKPYWRQLTGYSQQTYNISQTNEQSNNEHLNLNKVVNTQSDYSQNQFQSGENSNQDTHKIYGSHNLNVFNSNNHRQEHTPKIDSYSHVNTFETDPSNNKPLATLWTKLDNIELGSTLSTDINKPKDIQSTSSKEKESTQDIGRGDIDPEDLSDLVVDSKLPTSSFNRIGNKEATQNSNENNIMDIKKDEITDQHSLEDFRQQKNFTQLHVLDFKKHDSQEQQNVGRQIIQDPEQHPKLEHQNTQDLRRQEDFVQHSLQDYGQQSLQDFAQQSSQDFEQQNMHDFGQQNTQDFGQQNMQDSGQQNMQDFGQQNMKDFGQHDSLEQQNLQNVDQQNPNHEQHKHLHDFGGDKYSEQQNSILFEHPKSPEQPKIQDSGHQENFIQQNPDFKQYQNEEQQSLQDLEQHVYQRQHNLQVFGQQPNLGQQNIEGFTKDDQEPKNMQQFRDQALEQQNLQVFRQQENLEKHNVQYFPQQENLEQQNIHENQEPLNIKDFGEQHLEQQSLQDFEQKENIEQHNMQIFPQQQNLEQQNEQDFGQQNMQDFGQQNTQDFGHQNMQIFEQHDYLEQQNLQNVGQQHQELERNLQYPDNPVTSPKNVLHPQPNLVPLEEIEEPIQVQNQNNDLQSNSPQNHVLASIDPVTEKPGFWKSVGNKFSIAKSKISSWFQK